MALTFKVDIVVDMVGDGKVTIRLPGKKRLIVIDEGAFLDSYKPVGKLSMDFLLPGVDHTHTPTWKNKEDKTKAAYHCAMCTLVLIDEDGLGPASKQPCFMDTRSDPLFSWG